MHEYALCRRVVEIAEERSRGERVRAVNLVAGELVGCAAECMQLYFEVLTEGTVCENAALNIEYIKLSDGGGREFYVKSIEIGDT